MKLLEPGRIGKMEVRNRIVMAPMTAGLGGMHGEVTQRVVDWYEERARGGAGLICVEETLVTPRRKDGLDVVGQLGIDDWNQLPGWSELADAVHAHGAKISVQLNYTGPGMDPKLSPGLKGRGPSVFSFSKDTTAMNYGPDGLYAEESPTREMSVPEIEELIHDFGEAAFRAKKAGFDAVEIICYHGGPAAFLSPSTNKRTDRYGGDLEGRMRFPLEVLRAIKERLGQDFPVFPRIPADEFVTGGITFEEAKQIAKRFEENGADAISLVSGTWGTSLSLGYGASWPSYQKIGYLEPYAAELKNLLKIPVFMVGAMHFYETAERILDEGKADFIVMGRGLIADPELPKKLMEGRPEDIRRCIRCNECLACTTGYIPVHCSINPAAGNEKRRSIMPAKQTKNVLVIGGGPGGMEAARVTSMRGHNVTLLEKSDRLGGNLVPGSVPEFKKEIRYLIDWYAVQLKKLGVKIEFGKAAGADVLDRNPDVLIIGTGSQYLIPHIPGIKNAFQAIDILLNPKDIGDNVVIAGGGSIGCETGLYLNQLGKKVVILEMLDDILIDENPILKATLTEKLEENEIKWHTGMKLVKVAEQEAVIIDKNDREQRFHGDVVLALGMESVPFPVSGLKERTKEVYELGDCVKPRNIYSAIHEGYLTGMRI